jgi:glycerol-3-phosphate acyltransferase PlsY
MITFYLLVLFSYLFGAVPFGLLIGRFFADVDVRTMGSGNIGATNVNRVLGRKLGAATLVCDVLKGLLVVLLADILLDGNLDQMAWVGFAAFIGHCYPIYLRFQGGKGVATSFGVLAPVSFKACILGVVVWIIVVRISKVSAMGALVASLVMPIALYYFERNFMVTAIFAVMMAILVYRHKENIRQLRGR